MVLVGNADSGSREGPNYYRTLARTNPPWLPGLTVWVEASWALRPGVSMLCLMWQVGRWDKDKGKDSLQNQSCRYKSCRSTLGKCIMLLLCLLYVSSVERRGYRPTHSPDRTTTNPTQMLSIKLWDRHLTGRNNISPRNTVWDKLKLHKPSWYFSLHGMRTVTRWSGLGGLRENIIWDTLSTTQAGAHLIYRQWHFHISQTELRRLCLFLDSTSIRLVSGCIFVLSLKSAASISGLEKGFYT